MSMISPKLALAAGLSLALAACTTPEDQRRTAGALIGASTGFIAGSLLDFGDGWLVVSTLAGAAAGTLIARNTETNECAYATGDGGYETRSC